MAQSTRGSRTKPPPQPGKQPSVTSSSHAVALAQGVDASPTVGRGPPNANMLRAQSNVKNPFRGSVSKVQARTGKAKDHANDMVGTGAER